MYEVSHYLLVSAHEEVVRHVRVPGETLEVHLRRVRVPRFHKAHWTKENENIIREDGLPRLVIARTTEEAAQYYHDHDPNAVIQHGKEER